MKVANSILQSESLILKHKCHVEFQRMKYTIFHKRKQRIDVKEKRNFTLFGLSFHQNS